VVTVDKDRPEEEELAAAYQDASENAISLSGEWDVTSAEAWNGLD